VDVLRASSRRRFNRRAFLTRMVARSCYASPPRKRPKCCPLPFFREMNGLMLVRTILRSELAGNRSFPRFCGSADFSDRRTSIQDLAPKDHGGHFIKVEVKGKSGNGGIDGIGVLRVNLLSFQVFFQCKRYKDSVSASAIRDFRGAMVGRTDKGLFITTGRFTPDAKREATRDGAPQIELIDGEQLCELLKSLNLGLKTEMIEHVTVVPEVFREFDLMK
jgi:Restriction endonuclease